jgi:hypothetical protein
MCSGELLVYLSSGSHIVRETADLVWAASEPQQGFRIVEQLLQEGLQFLHVSRLEHEAVAAVLDQLDKSADS